MRMHYATSDELRRVYGLFALRCDIFPHVRQDVLRRRIDVQQCILQEGVAITFQQYKKRTPVGDIDIPAKSIVLHQIVNGGAGGKVFDRFCKEIVVPSGGDLYLTVRKENRTACDFYERHGMWSVGRVAWSGGTLPGLVYKKAGDYMNLSSVRTQGFPVYALDRRQKMEELRLLLRFDHTCIIRDGVVGQSMHGLALANTYHPHMWSIKCGKMRTPQEVYSSDTLLSDALKRRERMGKCETQSDLRKALKIYSGAQSVSSFRASAAAALYDRYLPSEGGVVYDPSAGFGGRMLGALSCRKVTRYIGVDPSLKTMDGLRAMSDELPLLMQGLGYEPPAIELHQRGSEDFRPERESIDCAMSSPPFFNCEKYSTEKTQSYIKFPTPEEWMHGFIKRTLDNCRVGLKRDGFLVINIAGVNSYPTLAKDFLALALQCGFRHRETLKLALSAMPGTRDGSSPFKHEPIFVFVKSLTG